MYDPFEPLLRDFEALTDIVFDKRVPHGHYLRATEVENALWVWSLTQDRERRAYFDPDIYTVGTGFGPYGLNQGNN